MILSTVGRNGDWWMDLTTTHFLDGFVPPALWWTTTGNAISNTDDGERFCLMKSVTVNYQYGVVVMFLQGTYSALTANPAS